MTSHRNCPVAAVAMADDDSDNSSPSIMKNEEVIQHIQSFLTRKEAVRTAMLSKQWYSAWSTNAVLYLDPHNFLRTRTTKRGDSARGGAGGLSLEFQNFATKSINRYKDMNLILHELRLWMNIRKDSHIHDHEATTKFYDKLILDALGLGVTIIDLNVKGSSVDRYYTLPPQVFNSATLKELSLDGCRINLDAAQGTVIRSGIVSLKLVQVEVEDDTMMNILSGCPLIKDLTLYECRGLEKVNFSVARCNLKNLSARHCATKKNHYRMLMAEFGTEDDLYPNLISLELDKVRVDNLFYKNFSCIFPFLEKFKLRDCEGPKEIQISSESVKCLSLIRMKKLKDVIIHVPRISNFHFTSAHIPSLLFHPPDPDHKWKSYIELITDSGSRRDTDILASSLRRFLSEMSSSEISLFIDLPDGRIYNNEEERSIINLHKVENLSVKFSVVIDPRDADCCIKKLCGLFYCCVPKFITPAFTTCRKSTEQGKEVVYKTLKKQVNRNKCHEIVHGVKCIHGLREVQVEIYDQTLKAWQPHPNPDNAWTPECEGDKKVRFSLKWN